MNDKRMPSWEKQVTGSEWHELPSFRWGDSVTASAVLAAGPSAFFTMKPEKLDERSQGKNTEQEIQEKWKNWPRTLIIVGFKPPSSCDLAMPVTPRQLREPWKFDCLCAVVSTGSKGLFPHVQLVGNELQPISLGVASPGVNIFDPANVSRIADFCFGLSRASHGVFRSMSGFTPKGPAIPYLYLSIFKNCKVIGDYVGSFANVYSGVSLPPHVSIIGCEFLRGAEAWGVAAFIESGHLTIGDGFMHSIKCMDFELKNTHPAEDPPALSSSSSGSASSKCIGSGFLQDAMALNPGTLDLSGCHTDTVGSRFLKDAKNITVTGLPCHVNNFDTAPSDFAKQLSRDCKRTTAIKMLTGGIKPFYFTSFFESEEDYEQLRSDMKKDESRHDARQSCCLPACPKVMGAEQHDRRLTLLHLVLTDLRSHPWALQRQWPGEDLNVQSDLGFTAIHYAVFFGISADELRHFMKSFDLAKYVEVTKAGKETPTPLQCAVLKEEIALASVLTEYELDPHATSSKTEELPLHHRGPVGRFFSFTHRVYRLCAPVLFVFFLYLTLFVFRPKRLEMERLEKEAEEKKKTVVEARGMHGSTF